MNEKQERDQELQRRLSELLTEGELEAGEVQEEGRRRISHPYEIVIQTKHDPIAEEIRAYRRLGKELDDRYDKYLEQVEKQNREK
ncbi:hypothetical protein JJQ72_15000 [Paenibacillus sp. F411]|uniref:Uncharacterized protein n=1 Tax=Paenibacillus algicola TaxID=2565926 RepID=A0A4P8XIP4_9BACL|nr:MULTISPECIES: hypothetical protein [Paenibacillus]MBO2945282.1 hypothetical protein [Paenibacillus sp. F411]QCT01370.1 hypothetical protein E6C60_0648 [Paenibacillus algicola]